jgi:SAM-dependent methyltransferase
MSQRHKQTGYSELQPLMLDETSRRQKAEKIIAVLAHFLGRTSLDGLRLLDIGCSAGLISVEFARAGADVIGVDIDEPGVAQAKLRFGDEVRFALTDGERLPVGSDSMDIVVLNHIYEHVLNPAALVDEIRRVLAPTGAAYLALGNRLGVMEPHYRLPFLSWLPRRIADSYVRLSGRAEDYHERFLTRPSLRRLFDGLVLWDYTLSVMSEPERFKATDMVSPATGRRIAALPRPFLAGLIPLVPTYIWVATSAQTTPAGPPLRVPPRPVASRASLEPRSSGPMT